MGNLVWARHIQQVCGAERTTITRKHMLNSLECIAEYTRRPLLSLTCSDIGTDPETVEKRLNFWFKLAKNWGTILLIDEADVYMEQRTITDLARNNLVAGFLRALEYYQGILFLTTNRVGTFDEALLSRIAIPIYYPDFNDEQRAKIWKNFFRKLETERERTMRVPGPTKYYVTEDKEILDLKLNGREIRNGELISIDNLCPRSSSSSC